MQLLNFQHGHLLSIAGKPDLDMVERAPAPKTPSKEQISLSVIV
jgi:hypothetical protein